jgi:hypothetical protein
MCKTKLQFGHGKKHSTLVLKFNNIFSIRSSYGQKVFYFPTYTNPMQLRSIMTIIGKWKKSEDANIQPVKHVPLIVLS